MFKPFNYSYGLLLDSQVLFSGLGGNVKIFLVALNFKRGPFDRGVWSNPYRRQYFRCRACCHCGTRAGHCDKKQKKRQAAFVRQFAMNYCTA